MNYLYLWQQILLIYLFFLSSSISVIISDETFQRSYDTRLMFCRKTSVNCFAGFSWIFSMRLDKRELVDLVKGRTNNCFRRSSSGRYDWTSDRTSPDDKSRVFLRERAESVRDDLDASERGIEKWTVHRCTQPIGSKHGRTLCQPPRCFSFFS